jgi:hypothetical protein
LDAIDADEKATGESNLVLPGKDDQRKESALAGKPISLLQIFLSWFYHAGDIVLHLGGTKLKEDTRARLQTASSTFDALAPELSGKWLPTQMGNMAELEKYIQSNTDHPDGPFQPLLQLTGTRHVEAFVRVLHDNSWRYMPHRQLPSTTEEDESMAQVIEDISDDDMFTGEAISLNAIAELDPDLKNFLINILGEKDLGKQATAYYDLYDTEGSPIVWFRYVDKPDCGFHFIQQQDKETRINHFWVRLTDGTYLRYQFTGRSLTYIHNTDPILPQLPTFVRDTSWAKQPMTASQYPHVRDILRLSEADLKALQISKLSASALMSNKFGGRTLERITRTLPLAIKAREQGKHCPL